MVSTGSTRLEVYYSILGVGTDAGEDEIRRAYRLKARLLHPDMGGNSERMKLLNEAFEILSELAGRNPLALAADYPAQEPPTHSVEKGSTRVSAPRVSYALRWLIARSVCSFVLGLICFAESGNESLIPHGLYLWLLRALAVVFLLQGAGMLYAAHLANQLRSEAVTPEEAHIRTFRLLFQTSVCGLVVLVSVSMFLN